MQKEPDGRLQPGYEAFLVFLDSLKALPSDHIAVVAGCPVGSDWAVYLCDPDHREDHHEQQAQQATRLRCLPAAPELLQVAPVLAKLVCVFQSRVVGDKGLLVLDLRVDLLLKVLAEVRSLCSLFQLVLKLDSLLLYICFELGWKAAL